MATKRRPASRSRPKPTAAGKPIEITAERLAEMRRIGAERDAPRRAREARLIAAIKSSLPELEKLLEEINGEWRYEDFVYRFYHQSFKVYGIQGLTRQIVAAIQALLPDAPLNEWFATIVAAGTGRKFEMKDNRRWLEATRPMLEAFFHAKYFLEMVCKHGRRIDEPQQTLSSGWASVLYLYGLR
jgi:hypothetical protein